MKTPALFLLAVFASACAHQQPKKESQAPTTAAPARASAAPAQPLKHDAVSAGGDEACGPVRVHFALDSAQVEANDTPLLEKTARCFKNGRVQKAVLDGHADERGTEEYNLALGDWRAHAVEEHLERLGVDGKQLETVSRGELDPICQEHDEACWAQNRRVGVKPK